MSGRRFVQIAAHPLGYVAVACDGTAWDWSNNEGWKQLPDLPQPGSDTRTSVEADLLAALKGLLTQCNWTGTQVWAAEAAIAKAELPW